ncbi:T9SS type B sorting domain-containing protein [Flavobacterium sp.]|uniref:T9SS type B sorting domain-containing protein n=1 Tax=Flavobacterium sp. TaxID=239 RepID=UPI003C4FEDA4
MKKLLYLFFLLLSISSFSQLSKKHYIPPITGNGAVNDHYLYISTPSTSPVNIKIIEIGGLVTNTTVSNANPRIHLIANNQTSSEFIYTVSTPDMRFSNKGYRVEADEPVYVSMRINGGNQAGGIVSKGENALGTDFRIGAMYNPVVDNQAVNFVSVLATENNTILTISDIDPAAVLPNGSNFSTITQPIILNKDDSYILALTGGGSPSNSAKIIGALVHTDKPVAVACGSFAGNNGTNTGAKDVGFDQIVPIEKVGKEYIFIQGEGLTSLERVLLIPFDKNNPGTVTINGGTVVTPLTTTAGVKYFDIDGSQFINKSLYVTTTEKVFAYQSICGYNNSAANQNMFFVPPINCATPNTVNNIPNIDLIGIKSFDDSTLNIVTEAGSTVTLNGTTLTGATTITGNPNYEKYRVSGTGVLTGNQTIVSTKQVYVSYYGRNNVASYGGYYSGFDSAPIISFNPLNITNPALCIPNVKLSIDGTKYNTFQWYNNDIAIDPATHPGADTADYTPVEGEPGNYHIVAKINICASSEFISSKVPVSECPGDYDNDGINNNIDQDNDNDGITNCTESYGNQEANISNLTTGNITAGGVGGYSNGFAGTITSSAGSTIIGQTDGSFVTEIPVGKGKKLNYTMTFSDPITLGFEYVNSANASDLMNPNAEYIIKSDFDKSVTILDPLNQLLIDTDFDGIYEPNQNGFTSNEIRFKLSGSASLPAGNGSFVFLSDATKTLSFTHTNLSDTNTNKSTFKIYAVCVPIDSDGDGKPDQRDTDSDDDGILDTIEAQNNSPIIISPGDPVDANGIYIAFGTGLTPVDTDGDGIPDYLDTDSDGDGVSDSDESGTNALANSINPDADGDGISNYRELDSDDDGCTDIQEYGATTPANSSFAIADSAVILPADQPTDPTPICSGGNTSISVITKIGDAYQWEVSTDTGSTWTPIIDDANIYNGATTSILNITNVTTAMNLHQYKVIVTAKDNICSKVTSNVVTLNVSNGITYKPNVDYVICDDDLDGITVFNLTTKESDITSESLVTLSYYTSLLEAQTGGATGLISNPTTYQNTTAFNSSVWARIENTIGCPSAVSEIALIVIGTELPVVYNFTITECDDNSGTLNSNYDGIATFNLTSAETDIRSQLPTSPIGINYNIDFYKDEADALSNTPITNITAYRNTTPNQQNIWIKVTGIANGVSCSSIPNPFTILDVEALPNTYPVVIGRLCNEEIDPTLPNSATFNTSSLESTLIGSQNPANLTITYYNATGNPLTDELGNLITSPFPASFKTRTQIITAIVTNNTSLMCAADLVKIEFTVDETPYIAATPPGTAVCDDETNPLLQDGKYAFDTTDFNSILLGSQDTTIMKVIYKDQNGFILPSPLPNPFNSGTQDITAIVENSQNPTCTSPPTTISFVVNPKPEIDTNLNGKPYLICSDDPTAYVTLNAGLQPGASESDFSYKWFKDEIEISGAISSTYNATSKGIYTVIVNFTAPNDFCSSERKMEVISSEAPKFTLTPIVIKDLAESNSITINVTGNGDYEYSINADSSYFQKSNYFNNVSPGIYEVSVKDINGCGPPIQTTVYVIGAPKFFTPNNDGYNDRWNFKGIPIQNANSLIYIYDRYGKLLKQMTPSSDGWDGTFNGAPLPADDYWYTIKLYVPEREHKGHFSLKR